MKHIYKPLPSSFRYRKLYLFSILISCAFLMVNCGKKKDDFPNMLLGKWTTEAEQYRDRYIEITPEMIIFGTGDNAPNIFFIQKIKQKQNGSENEYTFECTNTVNTDFIFSFLVESSGDSLTFRLKNPREVVWKKEAESDSKTP